ncbi:hypothetical protein M422DRAFT_31541 [Sphaerobolus stellatus SS14]|uniref:Uncharacterized protein n=1 Tax=Sphaerobolus stellatus (strain SS14) TaxID=990650 RepID=A0A0C9VTM6_SPHS4|nr:hypothetical protein M422DRAFT_31541 [Sphaerobolus stellatus SS14]
MSIVTSLSLKYAWIASKNTQFKPGCHAPSSVLPPIYGTLFYSPLALEIVFFLMMIYQAVRVKKALQGGKSLIENVVRAGIMFFFLTFLAILFITVGGSFPSTATAARFSNGSLCELLQTHP